MKHQSTLPAIQSDAAGTYAFTLIELSIVLVIIGLIVGGILVGRDLISAAEVRAQISQIERFNQAVNAFRGKFGYLPGDIPVTAATQFGFANAACAGTNGLRDGNGVIEGNSGIWSLLQGAGETGLFWNDLSSAAGGNLIEGSFTTAVCNSSPTLTSTGYNLYFPSAKIGSTTVIYAYSLAGNNYFGMSSPNAMAAGDFYSSGKLTVAQAYSIDVKTDDGLPITGRVMAKYMDDDGVPDVVNAANSAPANTFSCYDSTAFKAAYAVSVNNGKGANCGLSFRFQ